MSEKELQEKILSYRLLEARADGVVKQRDFIISKVMELQSTLNSIDEIGKSDGEVLFPVGGEAYKTGKVVDNDRIVVEIGASVALEKSTKEGKAILEKRKNELESSVNQLQQELIRISETMNKLAPEIQNLINKNQNTPQAG